MYKYAENKQSYSLTVSEFYEAHCNLGIYKQFGIQQDKFENILRYLQEDKNKLLKTDIVADLDNIHLSDDITSDNILEIIKNEI